MVGVPSWLYYLFGVLMLAVAAYCLTLLMTSAAAHRTAGRDVEVSHVVMGLAMAGMYVPAWSFGPSGIWELIFAALLIWFVVESILSIQHFGLHVPHTVIHAVMSFAMLLMYWFPRGATSGTMSMAMSQGGGRMDPGLAFLVAFVLFGSVIFTVASPNRGATHFGTHGDGSIRSTVSLGPGGEQVVLERGVDGIIGTPSLVDASHVVMSLAMGLMLILMI